MKKETFCFKSGYLYQSDDECTTASWKGGLIIPICVKRESENADDYVTVLTLFQDESVDHLVMHHVEQKMTFRQIA